MVWGTGFWSANSRLKQPVKAKSEEPPSCSTIDLHATRQRNIEENLRRHSAQGGGRRRTAAGLAVGVRIEGSREDKRNRLRGWSAHGRGPRRDLETATAGPQPAVSCGLEADQRATGDRDQVCGEEPATAVALEGRSMVTEKDVSYVADLAYLELTEDERLRMLRDLNSILGYIDRLNELDTSAVEPMAQVASRYGVDESKQGSERFAYANREDVVEGLRKSLPQEIALENAPDADGTFFRVPKVIER